MISLVESNIKRQIEELVPLVAKSLSAGMGPAVSFYELGKLFYCHYRGESHQYSAPLRPIFDGLVDALLTVRLLTPIQGLNAFLLFGQAAASAAEIVCSIDPFAYVSHLSAMEYHGLTDKMPKIVYLTRPPAADWRRQAEARMNKDLGDSYGHYKSSGLPRLVLQQFTRLGHTVFHVHHHAQRGAFKQLPGTALRVANIGRVFLDMLREPKSCGGIQHVLDVYKREAPRYLPLIVAEIEQHGRPIDKVRAGFILAELGDLKFDAASKWKLFSQRGGSRKLDPDSEYEPVYSTNWQLSINVPSVAAELERRGNA